MSDGFMDLIKEIGSYNILNNLLPGSVYSFYLYFFASINYMNINALLLLFLLYFEGLFISRVGSFIEPYVIKLLKVETRDYTSFVKAEKVDPKIQTLQRDANMYRTLMIMQALSLISIFLLNQSAFNLNLVIIMSSGFIVFMLSYKKQYKYLIDRIDIALNRIGN